MAKYKYTILEQNFSNEEMKNRAFNEVEQILEEINNIKDISDWLGEILEINRYQTYSAGEWETQYYEFLITSGGPTIYLNTGGRLEYYWYPDKLIIQIEEKSILDKLSDIEDYLNEIC